MNQVSKIPFGNDASVMAGYAYRAGDRLGRFDLVIENTGDNVLSMQVREAVSPSGFSNLGAFFTVNPGGTVTKSYTLLSEKVAFFGSGNTVANVSTVIRNKANLRGAEIDIVVTGRKGWGFDEGFDQNAFKPNWGSPDSLV
jgi:hypothetical protein